MSSRTTGNTCGDCVFFGRRTGIVRTRNVCERPGAKCRAAERDEHACGSYQASPRTSFGLSISRASRAVTAAKAPVSQPRPAPGRQILCDTHCHTLFSRHAYSTLEEDVRAAAVDYGGEFVASVVRIVERAVVAAKREGVIVADEYKEEGSVAGAAHEALTQVMSKALGLNVGGKIGIARKGNNVAVAVYFEVGLLHLSEAAVGLGHRAI